MTDLYAFSKSGDPAKSRIVLNVHPSFYDHSLVATSTSTLDASIGYLNHTDTVVPLYLRETFYLPAAHRGGSGRIGSALGYATEGLPPAR